MNEFLLIISILGLAFATCNTLLNGKVKAWDLIVIPPMLWMLIILGILFLVNLLTGNYIPAILNFVTTISFLPHIDFGFNSDQKKGNIKIDHTVKIISLNTLYFGPNREQELANFIQNKRADIVFLQELFTNKTRGEFPEKGFIKKVWVEKCLDYDYVKPFFPEYKNLLISNDRGILTNYPIKIVKEYKSINFTGYLIAKVTINHKDLYLVNAHMNRIWKKGIYFEERKRDFTELYKDLKKLKDEDKRFVLAGDFNLTKASRWISHLFEQYPETVSNHNFGFLNSWHTKLLLWRLDFMFFNPRKDFYAFDSKLFDSEGFSDHRGIESEFILE